MAGHDSQNAKGHSYADDFANIYGDDKAGAPAHNSSDNALHSIVSGPTTLSTFDAIDTLNAPAVHDPNATPDILLEQLAYVDNFIPSLDQDFGNIDSWVLGEGQQQGNNATNTTTASTGMSSAAAFGLDEQLAVELSAFADEVFIFPDEDKPAQDNNENEEDNGDNDDGATESTAALKRRHELLSQRRNRFLTSQYDHSRARFAAGRAHRQPPGQADAGVEPGAGTADAAAFSNEFFDDAGATGNRGAGTSPDHGGFTNFVVDGQGSGSGSGSGSAALAASALRQHAPSVSSPLARQQGAPANNASTQIHMPDYSQIPTATLVALLPRVIVPQGARDSLVRAGFSQEQIDAISAIIAYNEQNKQQPQRKGSGAADESGPDGDNGRSNSDKGAHFLLDLLSTKGNGNGTGTTPRATPLAADMSPAQQGLAGFLQMDSPVKQEPESALDLSARHTSAPVTAKHSEKPSPVNRNSTASLPPPPPAHTQKQPPLKKQKVEKPAPATQVKPTAEPPSQSYSQKKKQKDKELENSINELSSLAMTLQQKIHTLEMENKLLKDLVVSSGEMDGIEQAELIKKNLLKKAHQSAEQESDSDSGAEEQHDST
ncbi:Met4 protein [Maudiozyma humilis]|uniref:Met4 protein n=1 Tax=Maudiozyma humilis TaxID=51915 RepID=A0AAV5RQV4_MAUHU|nr:Met4 protein [Kazachstania humilis]